MSPTRNDAFRKIDRSENDGEVENAKLILPDGREIPLRLLHPTMGDEIALDVRTLFNNDRVLLYDPGFNSVAACTSAVTYIDGDAGVCRYRGYDRVAALSAFHTLRWAHLCC